MGMTVSKYRGYGKTTHEAALALAHMLQYHHNQTVSKDKVDGKLCYFVFDGFKKRTVYFSKSNDRWCAFLFND
jgi:hypothetical protein